jgi:secreted PhoX family phosphatase
MSTPVPSTPVPGSGWDRRTLLKTGLAAAAVAGGPFAGFVNAPAGAVKPSPRPLEGLRAVKDERDGTVRLHVPKGFRYRSFHDTEQPVELPDATLLPGRHDGMGAFGNADGSVTLVRNHEVNSSAGAFGPATAPRYDAQAGGGTTSVAVDRFGNVSDAWTSLSGTLMNCSGGIMPWGSWITCEETVNGPDVGPDFTGAPNTAYQKPHGYVFEVPAEKDAALAHEPRPLTRAGRFAHEAVSFDPVNNHLYLTEDNFAFASGFYRYEPATAPTAETGLADDGDLYMLKVKGQDNAHLEASYPRGAKFDVEWVKIEEPDPSFPMPAPGQEAETSNDDALTFVSRQGWAQGAAYFSRTEGQVYEDGVVFFTSTQGGGAPESGNHDPSGFGNGHGQVWAYDTRNETLTLVYESPGPQTLDFPDNITTRDGVLVLCEDGDDDNYLRALTPEGELWNLAWNRLRTRSSGDRTDDEFAGSTFSPDGHTLYVNIQASKGMTFAIWGPWEDFGF